MEDFPLEKQIHQKDQLLKSKDELLNEKDTQLQKKRSAAAWQLQKSDHQMQHDKQLIIIAELQKTIEALLKPTWVVKRDDITVFENKELGKGTYGVVNEAKFQGCRVAVKFLHDMIMSPYYIKAYLSVK